MDSDGVKKWLSQQAKHSNVANGSPNNSRNGRDDPRLEQRRYRAVRRQSERQDQAWRQDWRTHQWALAQLPPQEIAEQIGNKCQYCGSLLVPKVTHQEVLGNVRPVIIWPDYCGCDRGRVAILKQQNLERFARDKVQKDLYLAYLKRAGLVGWLAGATFNTFNNRHDWPGAADCKERVSRYIDMLFSGERERNNWLVMYGNFGTGKSHLAAAIIHEAIERGWRESYFRVWPEYLKRLQLTWDKDEDGKRSSQESEADIIRELQQGLIVVIDDLDKRQPTEWVKSTLYTALNYRYNAEMPTILTFNYGPGDSSRKVPGRLALEDYLGKAVLDRILEVSFDVIEFGGASYRSGGRWNITDTKAA